MTARTEPVQPRRKNRRTAVTVECVKMEQESPPFSLSSPMMAGFLRSGAERASAPRQEPSRACVGLRSQERVVGFVFCGRSRRGAPSSPCARGALHFFPPSSFPAVRLSWVLSVSSPIRLRSNPPPPPRNKEQTRPAPAKPVPQKASRRLPPPRPGRRRERSSPFLSASRVLAASMETYTTDDALTMMGFGRSQALVLVYAGMGWVAEAMELMLLSFLGPFIRNEWNISPQNESMLSSVVFAGMLLGACAWGFVSDKYGRRTGLLFSTMFTSGMGCLSALSPNYLCLVALRFLVGVGVGGSHVFISWFLEFIPAQNRGTWMIVFSLFWTLGTILEASLAWVVLPALNWRWLLALTALPCFLLLPFFGLTPESPRYLCVQNRMSDATAVLERMASANQSALPPGVLTYHSETKVDHNTLASESECLLPMRAKECTVDDAMSSKSGSLAALRTLLSHNLLRSTLLLWLVFFANSFAYYGIVLLTSELSDANRSCASGVIFGLHKKDTNIYKDTFITSLAEIPGLILSAVLVDWLGRKASMWSMMFVCCAFLGPLVFHQNELWTTILLFGARACAMGSFTVLCLYAPEVYPTSVRSTGAGIATAIGRVGGVICPLVAVAMLGSCHQMEALVVFEVVLFLAAVACMFFPVETKGRGMD